MAEFLTRDIKVAISKTLEASYNAGVAALAANYMGVIKTDRNFAIPQLEFTNDTGKIGPGNEHPTVQTPNYWSHMVMPISDDLNTDVAAVLLARCLSGGDTVTGTTGPITHALAMDVSSNRQLNSFGLVSQIGYVDGSNPGADFLFSGVVVDSFTVSQTRADRPTFTAELVGSGKWVSPSGFNRTTGDPAELPVATNQNYTHGASVIVSYGGASPINFGTEGRIRGWTWGFSNNARRDDRRPNDPFRTAGDPTTGAYVNRIYRGPRTCTASLTVSLDQQLREFVQMRSNTLVTNVTFTCKGDLIGAGNQTFEFVIPRAYVSAVGAAEDGDDAAVTLEFMPVKIAGQPYVKANIINATTAPIV